MDLLPSCSHHAHTTIKVNSAIGEESMPRTVENDGDARCPNGRVSNIAHGTVLGKAVIGDLVSSRVE